MATTSKTIITHTTVAKPSSITVVVLDAKSQPVAGASVSITPADATAVTNSAGEAQFNLGTAMKYSITATYDSNTVTVPYYVTQNGATRLVVNPVYVKSIEAQLHPSFWSSHSSISTFGIIIGIVVIIFIIWRFFRREK